MRVCPAVDRLACVVRVSRSIGVLRMSRWYDVCVQVSSSGFGTGMSREYVALTMSIGQVVVGFAGKGSNVKETSR